MNNGKVLFPVQIVGVGNGNPDLLTIAAHKAIGSADVVVYDSGQSESVLALRKSNAMVQMVHKKRAIGEKIVREQVVDVLETHYRMGKKVVRLKVGDALIFGRGAAEASIMRDRGINVEIIPGITAAVAVAAKFGVRQTEKGESDSLTYYMAANYYDNPQWILTFVPLLMQGGTVVVYMGLHCISDLSNALITAGVPAEMPVALVEKAELPGQLHLLTDLGSVAKVVKQNGMFEPVVFYVGQFVNFTLNVD